MENNNPQLVDDIYGKALLSYLKKPNNQEILVHSDIAETDSYPISWFFRTPEQFPELETIALDKCFGKILDVGAGVGIHALALQNEGKDVSAIDLSPGSIEVMRQNGVKKVREENFYTLENEKYDTLLFLMNGFGIMGEVNGISKFFEQADKLLASGGQILADSSDLIHLYKEEDGSVLIDLNADYYGEITYQMEFEGEKGHPFPWLFIDFGLMQEHAELCGFKAVKIFEEESNQYLAQITRK